MSKELKVHITGQAGTGRATLANVLLDTLAIYGVQTECVGDNGEIVLSTKRIAADTYATIARLSHMGTEGVKVTISTELERRVLARSVSDLPPSEQSVRFLLGNVYQMQNGAHVRIVECNDTPHYESVRGDDDIWRYNRPADRGRVTGSAHDFSDPNNLVPLYATSVGDLIEKMRVEMITANRELTDLRAKLAKVQSAVQP